MSNQPTTLDQLSHGAVASVVGVDVELGGDLAQRLEDLGFTPGTPVTVGRSAPFGDPIEYFLRGFRLGLRRSEAALIVVTTTT